MINKYYNDVIEQVYNRVGKTDKNIVMACYNNEFSIHYLENIRRYSHNTDGIYFAWHEYLYDSLPDAYAPFLDVICDMYRKQIDGDFGEYPYKSTLILSCHAAACVRTPQLAKLHTVLRLLAQRDVSAICIGFSVIGYGVHHLTGI